MTLFLGGLVVLLAIYAVVRRIDVRLALGLAALALGILAGSPAQIVQVFLQTMASEKFVVPICTAMGFAYVLRQSGCDQHLIHLLTNPLTRLRPIIVPGAVLVGFLVNIPVISQTSTAIAIGSVLIPLLRAAQVSPLTTGAALLLGSSLGGELLNPGAPELRTVSTALSVEARECARVLLPFLLLQLTVATLVFWALSVRPERAYRAQLAKRAADPEKAVEACFRVNLVKAFIPLLPLVILFVNGPPLNLLPVPENWLVDTTSAVEKANFSSRLIGAAMLIGAAAATLATPRSLPSCAKSFFDGAGYAYTHVISLIVVANCFGRGVQLIGLQALLDSTLLTTPTLVAVSAAALPLGFAALCGSGMAATQSVFGLFVRPVTTLGLDGIRIGALVSIGSAAGRTMSPVAAVTLMTASMTDTQPTDLARRVAGPLIAGLVTVVLVFLLTR